MQQQLASQLTMNENNLQEITAQPGAQEPFNEHLAVFAVPASSIHGILSEHYSEGAFS